MTTDNDDASTTEGGETTTTSRSIGELLALGTYQGCTDEEIQKIIDFRVDEARMSEETKAKQAAIITEMNENVELYTKANQEMRDLLKEMVGKGTTLQKVADAE